MIGEYVASGDRKVDCPGDFGGGSTVPGDEDRESIGERVLVATGDRVHVGTGDRGADRAVAGDTGCLGEDCEVVVLVCVIEIG